ncbi:hypothetical protein [Polaribacter sp. IC073]|uniref:hypothetical protein n=1 Tax=Polaribacter sp. IC073 TaxID=2508540 RepID=UPI0011BDADF6|nr:hypothetical protein [Polaribacter sp. IC073]TXD49269.1 hypothetical protein ES045_04175 [Polaribacter sp. IC073]
MKHVILAISLLAFVSCKDRNNKEKTIEKDGIETTEIHQKEEIKNLSDNSWIKEIKTNNGSKWKANTATNDGVQQMEKSIETQTTNTLEDYYALAKQLSDDKDFVLKNCTMKGASHDNLHVWLLPLMGKIEALSEAKTLEDASKLKQSIVKNVNEYTNYFE